MSQQRKGEEEVEEEAEEEGGEQISHKSIDHILKVRLIIMKMMI